ncbi:hypothetical protein Tco_0017094 [Tanacetum coccineum]
MTLANPSHDLSEATCKSKALEKASKSQAVIEAIGEPIARGPWCNASLVVTHKRHSVSCTFPFSGPQGSRIFQLRVVRNVGAGEAMDGMDKEGLVGIGIVFETEASLVGEDSGSEIEHHLRFHHLELSNHFSHFDHFD